MNPRVEYEMSEAEEKEILEASKPVPYIMAGGISPSSPQENANRAWGRLGKKRGFDHMTVRPDPGKGLRFFTAVPSETEKQQEERKSREKEEARVAGLKSLAKQKAEIEARILELS